LTEFNKIHDDDDDDDDDSKWLALVRRASFASVLWPFLNLFAELWHMFSRLHINSCRLDRSGSIVCAVSGCCSWSLDTAGCRYFRQINKGVILSS